MTPPIGFRAKANPDATNNLMKIRPLELAEAGEAVALPAVSPLADYAYRIAALTAGLALISTFL